MFVIRLLGALRLLAGAWTREYGHLRVGFFIFVFSLPAGRALRLHVGLCEIISLNADSALRITPCFWLESVFYQEAASVTISID